jgi:hypothetical protein
MKRWIGVFFVMLILGAFSLGCATVSKDTKIKCPKCGTVFTVEEGLKEIEKKGW